jgi:hypothetical protein
LTTTLYIDADACPVKEEAVRVAERHGFQIHFVANSWMRLPQGHLVSRVVVPEGPDAADNWIAERAGKADIVVTADIPPATTPASPVRTVPASCRRWRRRCRRSSAVPEWIACVCKSKDPTPASPQWGHCLGAVSAN